MWLDLENGKYTVIIEPNCQFYCLRYGEKWRDLTGDNLVYLLASELEALREKVKDYELGKLVEESKT